MHQQKRDVIYGGDFFQLGGVVIVARIHAALIGQIAPLQIGFQFPHIKPSFGSY